MAIFENLDVTPPAAIIGELGCWGDEAYNNNHSSASNHVMIGEEYEAWLAAEHARVAAAKKNVKKYVKHVDVPSEDAWTNDPLSSIMWPLGAFLEPEGWVAIQQMRKPKTVSYRRLMPRTWALARTIHQALPELDIWAKQTSWQKINWETITAGDKVEIKGRPPFYKKAMSEWDVLQMLTNPEARGLANSDRYGDRFSRVCQVRIDIDLDEIFDCWEADVAALDDLRDEIGLIHDVFGAFGLTVSIFRTGNRGVQAVASIAWMERAAAWVLMEAIRTVLKGAARRTWRATDFKSNLDGLMRLPLGLHRWSSSLAVFLDRNGRVIPADQQPDEFVRSFVERQDYCWTWAEEMQPILGETHVIPTAKLREIVECFPLNSLVQTFLKACQQFGVEGWIEPKFDERDSHTKEGSSENDVEIEVVQGPDQNHTHELDSHTKERGISVGVGKALPASLKAIGQTILDAAYKEGESFGYYVNRMKGVTGKNAVGWALVVNDGDKEKAKAFLDQQAEDVPGNPESIAARKALIAWCIEGNDTYERFARRAAMRTHKSVDVIVDESHIAVAERIISALPELRRGSAGRTKVCRTKVFTAKSLDVIRQALAVIIAIGYQSPDGLIAVSERTLASRIGTTQANVKRGLRWVTKGHEDCLMDALEIVEMPAKITEPTVYKLGSGL